MRTSGKRFTDVICGNTLVVYPSSFWVHAARWLHKQVGIVALLFDLGTAAYVPTYHVMGA